MATKSKKLRAAYKGVDRNKDYPLAEAAALVKGNASSKFDETIEIALNLGVDPRHADQMVRGVVSMPNGTGKTMRVAVFAKDAKADEAKDAGADLVGADDLAEAIQNGESAFDRVIATPDMMGVVGRLGKFLGPRGLMPNPKLGTVTADPAVAVAAAKAGEVQYRAEKAGVVHAGIAKASFEETPEMFLKAAKHAELDLMTGVSANIMCGQDGYYGTGSFQVLLDHRAFKDAEDKYIEKQENLDESLMAEDNYCSISNIEIKDNLNIKEKDTGTIDDDYDIDF